MRWVKTPTSGAPACMRLKTLCMNYTSTRSPRGRHTHAAGGTADFTTASGGTMVALPALQGVPLTKCPQYTWTFSTVRGECS
eukprot:350500-Chlamydomonas_euryale.AAC.16